MTRTPRKAALAAALALATSGIAVAVAAPAEARPPCYYYFTFEKVGSTLHVESHGYDCANPEDDGTDGLIRLSVSTLDGNGNVVVRQLGQAYGVLDYPCPGTRSATYWAKSYINSDYSWDYVACDA